MEASRCVCNVI